MGLEKQYDKLKQLIVDEVNFHLGSDQENNTLDINLSVKSLDEIGFTEIGVDDSKLEKCLSRLAREDIVLSCKAHVDPYLSDMRLGIPPFYDYYTVKVNPKLLFSEYDFTLELNTGSVVFRKDKIHARPNSKQFKLLLLLNSDKGKLFTNSEIAHEIWEALPTVSVKKNISDTVGKIRGKLKRKKLPNIFNEAEDGYSLKK